MIEQSTLSNTTDEQPLSSPGLKLPPEIEWIYSLRSSPWKFLSTCVWTRDEADKENPIKKFITDSDPYIEPLEYIAKRIVEERILAIVKHRRMRMTWTCCAIYLWDAMFFEGRFNVLCSKKEEDSDELVQRCKFIYDNIPDHIMPYKPKMTYKYTEMKFPETGSIIKGFAQGADQLRQRGCSRILADEFAFWPDAENAFVAMKPTLQGGGKVCLLSTRYPGFFKRIVEDTIDEK